MNQQPAEQDSPRYRTQPTISSGDCRLVDDALEEYALGVANPSQCVAIERHMAACTRCAALVDGYRQTVAALALAVPLFTPPASARIALMSRISATPQEVAPPAAVFSGDLSLFRTPSLPTANFVAAVPEQSKNTNAWWRVYAAPLATLPLLLALGLVTAWGFNNYAKLNDANDVIAMQDSALAQMSDQSDLDEQQVMQLAFSPTSKRYNMTSDLASDATSSWGSMLADPVTGQAALQVHGLNPGYYAVLVQTKDGTMTQKATFNVGADGSASTAIDLGEQVSDFQSVHIRPSDAFMDTDIAVDPDIVDVLMAVIGPNINQSSGTGAQGQ